MKATDLLLQGGGFGLVVVDLGDVPAQAARRVPLTSWFRFRRAVENTRTVLMVLEQEPYAKTCASVVLTTVSGQLSAISQWPVVSGQWPAKRQAGARADFVGTGNQGGIGALGGAAKETGAVSMFADGKAGRSGRDKEFEICNL